LQGILITITGLAVFVAAMLLVPRLRRDRPSAPAPHLAVA